MSGPSCGSIMLPLDSPASRPPPWNVSRSIFPKISCIFFRFPLEEFSCLPSLCRPAPSLRSAVRLARQEAGFAADSLSPSPAYWRCVIRHTPLSLLERADLTQSQRHTAVCRGTVSEVNVRETVNQSQVCTPEERTPAARSIRHR